MGIISKYFKFKTINFYYRSLENDLPSFPNNNYYIKSLGLDDISQYQEIFKNENITEYENRLLKGFLCFGLFVEEEIIHFAWIAINSLKINEIDQFLTLQNKEICIFDVFTLERFRGQGIYQFMLKYISKWAIENDYKKIIIYSEKRNYKSINAILKSGFTYYNQLTFIKLLRFKVYI
jgi:GNAT superfamily N-acetyltransferase